MEVENTMYSGHTFEEETHEPKLTKCGYRYCKDEVSEGEGFLFENEVYCSSSCLVDELMEEGRVLDASQL